MIIPLVNPTPLLPSGATAAELQALARYDTDLTQALYRELTGHATAINMIGGTVRTALTANRSYFVSNSGSNVNDGLTLQTPFLNIQTALNAVQNIDLKNFNVIINVADGTYTENLLVIGPPLGSGTVSLIGDVATPANVIIQASATPNAQNTFDCLYLLAGANMIIGGMKFLNAQGGNAIRAEQESTITITSSVEFGAVGAAHMFINTGSGINISAPYTVSGGAGFHYQITHRSGVFAPSVAVTVTGTPAFSFFAYAQDLSTIFVPGSSYTGAATGIQCTGDMLSVINTGGGVISSFFPGTIGGSVTNGAIFV